jgi:hypothetical protein
MHIFVYNKIHYDQQSGWEAKYNQKEKFVLIRWCVKW